MCVNFCQLSTGRGKNTEKYLALFLGCVNSIDMIRQFLIVIREIKTHHVIRCRTIRKEILETEERKNRIRMALIGVLANSNKITTESE